MSRCNDRYAARIRTAAVRALENDKKPTRKGGRSSFQDASGAESSSAEPDVFTPGVGGTVVSPGDDINSSGDDSLQTNDGSGCGVITEAAENTAATDGGSSETAAARWRAAAAKLTAIKKAAESTNSNGTNQQAVSQ